jgi:hypothetical protein
VPEHGGPGCAANRRLACFPPFRSGETPNRRTGETPVPRPSFPNSPGTPKPWRRRLFGNALVPATPLLPRKERRFTNRRRGRFGKRPSLFETPQRGYSYATAACSRASALACWRPCSCSRNAGAEGVWKHLQILVVRHRRHREIRSDWARATISGFGTPDDTHFRRSQIANSRPSVSASSFPSCTWERHCFRSFASSGSRSDSSIDVRSGDGIIPRCEHDHRNSGSDRSVARK